MITLFCIRPKGLNVGNEVIFWGLKHFIREVFKCDVNLVSIPATNKYDSQIIAGLTSKTIYEINQYGHGVVIGGGNIYENGDIDIDIEALKSLEVPLMLFSLSMGRIYNRRLKLVRRTDSMLSKTVLALNDMAQYSIARDKATKEYLQHIGVDNVVLGGCPSIFINKMLNLLPDSLHYDKGGLLISIRNPDMMNIPLNIKSRVYADILSIIEFLGSKGLGDIRLLCHDYRDISFATSFQDIEYVYPCDVYNYLSLLRSCKLNITYRLHSMLPCLSLDIPTIKISYDERSLSLIETIGMGDWNIDMVKSGDTISQVNDRYNNMDELKVIRERAQPIWKELYANMLDVFSRFADDVLKCYR